MACLAEAREASEGWWGRQDSNLRSHEAADLQSAPFATRDTPPLDGSTIGPDLAGGPKTAMEREGRDSPDGGATGRVYGRSGGAKSTEANS